MGLTDIERLALDEVDTFRMVKLLIELIAIPSTTGSDGETEAQHWVASRLREVGLDVDLWCIDLDTVQSHPDFPGAEAPRSEAWGLVATTSTGDSGAPMLILCGHIDVVPPGDLGQWPDRNPWSARVTGDVVSGRGACDMKAGVIANIAAVEAISRARIRLNGRVAVHSVVSEEDGGLGAFATLQRGHTGDACIISEPTSHAIVTATAGALTFRIEVTGRSAHGSMRYEGISALDAFAPVANALIKLERLRNETPNDPRMAVYQIPYPLSIGTVRAGNWPSSVPDLLIAEGRYGVRIGEPVDDARRAFEEAVAVACAADPWLRDNPARVSWPGGQFASGQMPEGNPLLDVVRRAVADANGKGLPDARGAPYGSDLRLYAAAGIPTLHYGPGDVRFAHGPKEHVSVSELTAVCRALVLTILRTCGTR